MFLVAVTPSSGLIHRWSLCWGGSFFDIPYAWEKVHTLLIILIILIGLGESLESQMLGPGLGDVYSCCDSLFWTHEPKYI